MTVVLTVGKPNSGYHVAHELLHSAGIVSAQPSRREGISVADFQRKLLQASPGQSIVSTANVTIGRLWTELAIDLFLGNLDYPAWGWADDNTLGLADFWADFDPQVRFVLVYTSPELALTQSLLAPPDGDGQAAIPATDEIVADWTAFNTRLLELHQRHADRSLLVNLEELLQAPADFVLQSIDRLGLPLSCDPQQTPALPALPEASALALNLARNLLDTRHANSAELYRALQNASHAGRPVRQSRPASNNNGDSTTEASADAGTTGAPPAEQPTPEQLWQEYAALHAHQATHSLTSAAQQTLPAYSPPSANAKLVQENELLLQQLHQVQEELESLYLQHKVIGTATEAVQQQASRHAAEAAAVAKARDAAQKEAATLKQQLAQAHEAAAKRAAETTAVAKARDAALKDAATLKQQLVQTSNETVAKHAAEAAAIAKVRDAAQKEAATLKQQLAQAHEVAAKRAAETTAVAKARDAALKDAATLKQQLVQTSNETVAKHAAEAAAIAKVRDAAQKEAATLKQQLAQAHEAAAKRTAEAAAITKARDTAQKEAAALKQQLAQASETVTKRQAEVASITKTRDAALKETTTLKQQIAQAQQAAAAAQPQVDELGKENELLLLQLHQVQEELERYYLKSQELANAPQPDRFAASFWRRHTPELFEIDLRHEDLDGDNWYEAEHDGRWAGPQLLSTLQLPPLPAGDYGLDLEIVDAFEPGILHELQAEVAGATVPLASEPAPTADGYPTISRGRITLGEAEATAPWTLALRLPRTISPQTRGEDDSRELAVRVRSVRIVRL